MHIKCMIIVSCNVICLKNFLQQINIMHVMEALNMQKIVFE